MGAVGCTIDNSREARILLPERSLPQLTASYLTTLLMFAALGYAQQAGANYDEAKVPKYTLPDPLVLQSGAPVRDAGTWSSKRRPEILELFRSQVYGRSPGRPAGMTFDLASIDKQALARKGDPQGGRGQILGRQGRARDEPPHLPACRGEESRAGFPGIELHGQPHGESRSGHPPGRGLEQASRSGRQRKIPEAPPSAAGRWR